MPVSTYRGTSSAQLLRVIAEGTEVADRLIATEKQTQALLRQRFCLIAQQNPDRADDLGISDHYWSMTSSITEWADSNTGQGSGMVFIDLTI